MTPKDNELRMKIGLVVTHTDDELLFVRSEKIPNVLDALQEFAELVRQDERDKCAQDYLQDCADAVDAARLEEREACAALVEADGRVHPKAPDAVWAKTVAKLIRARGNHETT